MSIARFVLFAAVGFIAITMHGCGDDTEDDTEDNTNVGGDTEDNTTTTTISVADACDMTVNGDDGACQLFIDAGATCTDIWEDLCTQDFPQGAEYNNMTLAAACTDLC